MLCINKLEKLLFLFATKGVECGKIVDSHLFTKGVNIPSKNYTNKGNSYLRVGDLRIKGKSFVPLSNKKNASYNDILICFDGDPGRNSYGLSGVLSPSLYKISGEDKANIYMSINHSNNQNIIKSLTNGTTILHSPGSKNKLIMYKYETDLNPIFLTSSSIKEENEKIIAIKEKLIYKLIK